MAEDPLGHEAAYRGGAAVRKLAGFRVTLCGVGAVGSNLAENLARQGVTGLNLVDRDRVESHNLGTQAFGRQDVGRKKAEAMAERVYSLCKVEVAHLEQELTPGNIRKALRGSDLVVDAFDNRAGRSLVREHCRSDGLQLLHVGLFRNFAEVVWDEAYQLPPDAEGDLCDYPLARNVVLLAVTVASEAILSFLLEGRRRSFDATLRDLKVSER